MDAALCIAKDLIVAIKKLKTANSTPNRHMEALQKLSTIFEENSMTMEHQDKDNKQTSTDTTAPEVLRKAPHTHRISTRNNKPGILPAIKKFQPKQQKNHYKKQKIR